MQEKTRIALIPAYAPGPPLLELLSSAKQAGFHLVVVDDGSGSQFSDIFDKAAAIAAVLHHPKNLGKGCALKTGLQYISAQFPPPYTVVTLDADGQHAISDAVRVCEAAEQSPDQLILGSRTLREQDPLRSRLGNSVTRLVFRCTTGLRIHDTQTGLRSFGGDLTPLMLEIPGSRYEYEMNVLLEFARTDRPIRELPISTIYFDRNRGSHFGTVRDSCRIYRELLRFSAASFSCFLVDYALYSLLCVLTGSLGGSGIILSNLLARVVSASINYQMNRRLVFKSRAGLRQSGLRYFSLAVLILAGNTLVLRLLVFGLSLNRYWAKLAVEALFFTISYLAQRTVVFRSVSGDAVRYTKEGR